MYNKKLVVSMIIIVFASVITVGTFEFIKGINDFNAPPPANASSETKSVTMRPGDRVDLGNGYNVAHYEGFLNGIGFKFSVVTFVTSSAITQYTYDVYTDNGVAFSLEGNYFKITTVGHGFIVVEPVQPP